MKEGELRELAECCACHKKIGELPLPIFHKVTTERFILDAQAVRRQAGLEMMAGNVPLAQALSPGEDMAKYLGKATIMVCDECMLRLLPEAFMRQGEQDNG